MADGSADAVLEKRGRFSLKERPLKRNGWRVSIGPGRSLGRGRSHHHHPLTQFLPGFEGRNPFRRYRYRLTGFRIAGPAGRAVIQVETAESANFNAVTMNQCGVDGAENLRHRHLGILLHELWKAFSEQDDEFGAGHADILPEAAFRQAACISSRCFRRGVEARGSRESMKLSECPDVHEGAPS